MSFGFVSRKPLQLLNDNTPAAARAIKKYLFFIVYLKFEINT
ncbi:hypothetical protein M084_0267 [Bacteroides fragilis str. 3988 T1]|uniref:Uncharacterized protein n=1 Tax=Bacteroides fragilis str. 2-F-2 \|nr:hypothetical protein M101_0221 [Bacteroides fragilis str. 1007-1-F \